MVSKSERNSHCSAALIVRTMLLTDMINTNHVNNVTLSGRSGWLFIDNIEGISSQDEITGISSLHGCVKICRSKKYW